MYCVDLNYFFKWKNLSNTFIKPPNTFIFGLDVDDVPLVVQMKLKYLEVSFAMLIQNFFNLYFFVTNK